MSIHIKRKHKLLPHNYIAEEILLGIILIYPSMFFNILEKIKKEYFFLETHQMIYINLINIYKYKQLNIIELMYKLESNKMLYKIGGLKKITSMMKQGQIFINSSKINIYIEALIYIIRQSYIKRLMIQCGHNIIKLSYIPQVKNEYLRVKALSYLNFIDERINKKHIKTFKDLISEKLVEIKFKNKYLYQTQEKLILSGFLDIDEIISGLPNGDLIIIAGRPSMGKTSLAINIAYNVFNKQKVSICIFSLEMSSSQIFNKFISIASNIPIQKYIVNKINKYQWECITKLCKKLLTNNIYINDALNFSINYIEQISKKIKKKNNELQLIIIDYLQLIQLNEENSYTRSQELSYITRKLKLLAQFLKLPIIVLSQLNRNIEIRNEKIPVLSDLKESGCISFHTNITISTFFNNGIHLTNFKKLLNYSIHLNNLENKTLNLTNKIKDLKYKILHIHQQYIFRFHLNQHILFSTYNHKYLSRQNWIRNNHITYSEVITYLKVFHKNKSYIEYTKKILITKYSKVYDINIGNYFNFTSNQIILHNSIEQDSDIIMILHQQIKQDNQNFNKKILDINICKNRNGATGSCQIMFIPNRNVFKNLEKKT
uniref:DNA 5'-3' helicase n=1 Tax=Cliftonaea pectinata TaxID=2007206 RepID=A0A1Z1MQD8_9FLOR|nr:Replication helicase subunit [Cliftonaea pectinata]ARW67995.1 Replication helicase subunit [Cliftonaea pectinata]